MTIDDQHAASTEATDDDVVRRDTGMVWGIKESFMQYVRGWPGSTMDLAPGSGWLDDGQVYFSLDQQRPSGGLWFRGGVRLRAHGGLLDVTVADPRVEERDNQSLLTAETWSEGSWQRIPFAELQLNDASETDAGQQSNIGEDVVSTFMARARLHPEATALFDDTYPAGEPLSSLMIRAEQ